MGHHHFSAETVQPTIGVRRQLYCSLVKHGHFDDGLEAGDETTHALVRDASFNGDLVVPGTVVPFSTGGRFGLVGGGEGNGGFFLEFGGVDGSKPELEVSGVGGRRSFSGGDGWEGYEEGLQSGGPFLWGE